MNHNEYKLESIFIIVIAFFSLLHFTTVAQAKTTTNASFDMVETNGNFYQTKVNFQLSEGESQLILYSPDYDNLEVSMLEKELGSDNVISDSSKKQVVVNLKSKMEKDNTGSFLLNMKRSTSDIIYIRDVNEKNLVNENLVTSEPVKNDLPASALSVTAAMAIDNTTTTNNALASNNILSRASLTRATVTNPVITVDPATVNDFDNDLTVHGTWESNQTSITIYYRLNSSGVGSSVGEGLTPGIEDWTILGTYTGTAGVAHNFTATIPKETIRALTSGTINLYTNYLKPKVGALGTAYNSKLTVVPYAKDLMIYNGNDINNTSINNPYVARGNELTLTGTITTNATGTLKFIVDGDTTNTPSLNVTIPGSNAGFAQAINLDNLGKDDSKVHEAVYEFTAGGKVLASVKYYFVVGNELKLTVPQTIDFGSHLYTDFLNGFTADPDITGELSLFDGRTGTYSGDIGLSASATVFKNSNGNDLGANLYWGNTLIPDDGTGVQIGAVTPPTSTTPAYKSFTKTAEDNLKFVAPSNTSPQSGDYTSTITWTVNDTLQ